MKQHYCIVNDTVKENLIAYIRTLPVNPRAPMVVEAREETRTDKQNRLMWPLLKDLSDQVVWHGEKLSREEWKDLITVLVNQTQDQEQKSAPGINGGRVYFGVRTSKSSKPFFASSACTAGMPPAAYRSGIWVGPAGARWHRLGVLALISLNSFRSMGTPAS